MADENQGRAADWEHLLGVDVQIQNSNRRKALETLLAALNNPTGGWQVTGHRSNPAPTNTGSNRMKLSARYAERPSMKLFGAGTDDFMDNFKKGAGDFRDSLTPPLSTVQVVGDIYLDIIAKVDNLPQWDGDASIKSPIETVAGGSALNTAVQLSALLRTRRQRVQLRPVRRCVLHSRVGSDPYGDLVVEKIREAGVTLSATRAGGQGVCICLSGQIDRAFVSYKGSVAEFAEDDINITSLLEPGTSHIHFSAYYDCSSLQAAVPQLMERAKRECGATVSIVPQADPADEWKSGFKELLPHVDVLICNLREAASIAGVPHISHAHSWEEIEEAVRRLLHAGAPLVVVTLGSDGAIAATAQQWWYQPNRELPVIDATGCGDAFAAGFLFGWCGSRDVRRGLVYGCACGGAAVRKLGGSSPLSAAEVDKCMRRNDIVVKKGHFPGGLKSLDAAQLSGLLTSAG